MLIINFRFIHEMISINKLIPDADNLYTMVLKALLNLISFIFYTYAPSMTHH